MGKLQAIDELIPSTVGDGTGGDFRQWGNGVWDITNKLQGGAVGDGVSASADTDAFLAAVSAATTYGGGTILVPRPVVEYTINADIELPSGVRVVGKDSKLRAASDTQDIIRIEQVQDVRVEGLILLGATDTIPTVPGTQSLLVVAQSSFVHLKGIRALYGTAQGIIISGKSGSSYDPDATHHIWVDDSYVAGCLQGITVFEGPKDVWLRSSVLEDMLNVGIFVDDRSTSDTEEHMPERVWLLNNTLRRIGRTGTSLQYSIAVAGSRYVKIFGNHIEDAGQGTFDGIDPSTTSHCGGITVQSGQGVNVCQHIEVGHNTIARCSRVAVAVAGSEYVAVHHTTILDPCYNTPVTTDSAMTVGSVTMGDSSTQGTNWSHFHHNRVYCLDALSDPTRALRIDDSNCANNTVEDEEYVGTSLQLGLNDNGTNTRRQRIFLNGEETREQGATSVRPTGRNLWTGRMFFDTTLDQPIWYDGSGWVDATGTAA